MNMKHLSEGGKKILDKHPHSLVLERQIVRGLNGQPIDKRLKPSITRIVNELHKIGLSSPASHTGVARSPTTEYYNMRFKRYGGKQISKTPKTDLITNNDTNRISLKGPSGGWLFAHKVLDSKICFDFISDNSKLSNLISNQVNKYLELMISASPPEAWKTGSGKIQLKDLKFYLDDPTYDKLKGVYETIGSIFNSYEFKEAFVRYGASGLFKFGDNFGSSTHLLNIHGRTTVTTTSKLLTDSNEVGKISLTDLISGDLSEVVDKIQPKFLFVEKSLHLWVKKGKATESVMREGMLDWIRVGAGKAREYIIRIYEYMRNLMKKGVSFVLEKMGFVPSIVFNNDL